MIVYRQQQQQQQQVVKNSIPTIPPTLISSRRNFSDSLISDRYHHPWRQKKRKEKTDSGVLETPMFAHKQDLDKHSTKMDRKNNQSFIWQRQRYYLVSYMFYIAICFVYVLFFAHVQFKPECFYPNIISGSDVSGDGNKIYCNNDDNNNNNNTLTWFLTQPIPHQRAILQSFLSRPFLDTLVVYNDDTIDNDDDNCTRSDIGSIEKNHTNTTQFMSYVLHVSVWMFIRTLYFITTCCLEAFLFIIVYPIVVTLQIVTALYACSIIWPLTTLYLHGPNMRGWGFWQGKPYHDICSDLTSVSSLHWAQHPQECTVLVERHINAFLIAIHCIVILYLAFRMLEFFWIRKLFLQSIQIQQQQQQQPLPPPPQHYKQQSC